MATATVVPLSEYLRTRYEPDADSIDGKIEERPVGERDHSLLQRKLLLLLSTEVTEPYFICTGELRVQVSPENYRVPDLVLLGATAPVEQIVQTPPLLCIEILSPGDTVPETLIRARDYIHMGVPEVWLFDPRRRTVTV
jgi:Uma2 family endonuclease